MTFLILIIIILGWVVFEQYSAKKNKDVHAQEIKDIEDQRNEKFKKSPQFLDNTLKVNSVFERLVTTEIKNIEIACFFEYKGTIHKTEKEINLKYSGVPFFIKIYGDQTSCSFVIICKTDNILMKSTTVDFESNDDDTIIIKKVLKAMKKIVEHHKLKE